MPDTIQLLDVAIEVEEAAGRIYDQLALRFETNQEYGPLFSGLAAEEREHADRVRALRDWAQDNAAEVKEVGTKDLAILLTLAEDIEAMLRDDPRRMSLTSALATSFRLEKALSSAHAELVARSLGPQATALFRDLSQDDSAHAALLGEGLRD